MNKTSSNILVSKKNVEQPHIHCLSFRKRRARGSRCIGTYSISVGCVYRSKQVFSVRSSQDQRLADVAQHRADARQQAAEAADTHAVAAPPHPLTTQPLQTVGTVTYRPPPRPPQVSSATVSTPPTHSSATHDNNAAHVREQLAALKAQLVNMTAQQEEDAMVLLHDGGCCQRVRMYIHLPITYIRSTRSKCMHYNSNLRQHNKKCTQYRCVYTKSGVVCILNPCTHSCTG